MPIVTATEVTIYSNISATAGTITSSGLIPIVQEKINYITNNYFTTDLYVQGNMIFDATAKTIVASVDFQIAGFLANDEVFIYQSYRNDGYKIVQSAVTNTLTMATTESVLAELSGRSIMISVVKWPLQLKQIASQMVAYDYDVRPSFKANVKSHSLGPFSETYTFTENRFGYPPDIMDGLSQFTIARLM